MIKKFYCALSLLLCSITVFGTIPVQAATITPEAIPAGVLAEAIAGEQQIVPFNQRQTVNSNNVRFWRNPNSDPLGQVHYGTVVTLLSTLAFPCHEGMVWRRVRIEDSVGANGNAGRTGYIRLSFLS